jgi:hypothetical protein
MIFFTYLKIRLILNTKLVYMEHINLQVKYELFHKNYILIKIVRPLL